MPDCPEIRCSDCERMDLVQVHVPRHAKEEISVRKKRKGGLIIIGGREEKQSSAERIILKEIASRANKDNGKLLIITAATGFPKEVEEEYLAVFRELGVQNVDVLDVRTREDSHRKSLVAKIAGATVIFFTGGDQLRITSQMGNSPILAKMREAFEKGATIAGTSAGAAAMPETMLISGANDKSTTIYTTGMAPGLGLVDGVVIDSHFAERGRFGRLLGAVVENPRNMGIGIDENTAIITHGDGTFKVIGTGAVYIFDGSDISYSSLSDKNPEGTVSIFDIKLHILRANDCFDMHTRRPVPGESQDNGLRGQSS